jgi:tetratricopeptide (TPR) repeat protein
MSETRGGAAHENSVSGGARDVVQARDVAGGIHFHYGRGSQGVRPQQLPGGIRVFINRISDLSRLDELLTARSPDPETVVAYVIVGTAGVGKTSLALHWSHRVRDHFPDGQLYVDLRGYDPGLPVTPDQALERFLLALGVPAMAIPSDVGEKSSHYRSILAGKQMLVILDNAGTVSQVRPLIPGASRSLAVVTSRSRLSGLVVRDGAHRTIIDTLSEDESVELLQATTADYRSGDDPSELAELARLCAYLPLALRIAAERAASRPGMPLSQLIEDLRDESELWNALSTGDEDEADAVRTVFAWSYRALPENAARLFCLVGLHPGNDFSDAAAAALAGHAEGLRTSLDLLVGTCLLESKGTGRYQFHDLLRAYAVDRCHEVPQEEQLAAVSRVCEWYLHSSYNCALSLAHDVTLLFTLDSPTDIAPMTFADRSQAARWYAHEKSNLAGAVQAAVGTRFLLVAWRLAAILERIYSTYNHFQDWRATSLTGLAAAQELGLRENEAVMYESLGRLCRLTMQLDEAAGYYENAIAIHRDLEELLSVVKALNGIGWVDLCGHKLYAAHSSLEEALDIARTLDDRYWTATVLYSLGYTCLQLRRLDDADNYLAESLRSFRDLDDRLYESMVLTALSYLARLRGEAAVALAIAHQAVDISREMANQLWEAMALLYLGRAQRAVGVPGEALVSFQHAAVICRQEGDVSREAMALTGTGQAYSDLDRDAEAADFYHRAVTISRRLQDRWKLARSLAHLADALSKTGSLDEGTLARREAAAVLTDFADPKSVELRSQLVTALTNNG